METVIAQTLSVYLAIAIVAILVLSVIAGRALLNYRKHLIRTLTPIRTRAPEALRRELAGVFCRLHNESTRKAGRTRPVFLFFVLTLVAGLTFLAFVLHQLAMLLP